MNRILGIRNEDFRRLDDCRKVVWVPVKKYSGLWMNWVLGIRVKDFRIEDCRKVVWVRVKKVFKIMDERSIGDKN